MQEAAVILGAVLLGLALALVLVLAVVGGLFAMGKGVQMVCAGLFGRYWDEAAGGAALFVIGLGLLYGLALLLVWADCTRNVVPGAHLAPPEWQCVLQPG